MKKEPTLAEVYDELIKSNRLSTLLLVRLGIRQSDIAAALKISTGGLSGMFPKGVLKSVATRRVSGDIENS